MSPASYNIEWAPRAVVEIDQLRAFDAKVIHRAIEWLAYQAEIITRNRKPLEEPLEEVPDASWELRVGAHRVFYDVKLAEGAGQPTNLRTVRILGVILKGRHSTAAAVSKKP